MVRFFVCLLTVIGAIGVCLFFLPSTTNVAFEVGKVGIRWLYIIGGVAGFVAYKATK